MRYIFEKGFTVLYIHIYNMKMINNISNIYNMKMINNIS